MLHPLHYHVPSTSSNLEKSKFLKYIFDEVQVVDIHKFQNGTFVLGQLFLFFNFFNQSKRDK